MFEFPMSDEADGEQEDLGGGSLQLEVHVKYPLIKPSSEGQVS